MTYSRRHIFQALPRHDVQLASAKHYDNPYGLSAGKPFALWQSFTLGVFCACLSVGLFFFPKQVIENILLTILYIFTGLVIIKLVLFLWDFFNPVQPYRPENIIDDSDLPVYSVVVALYQEHRSVPYLMDALLGFDYPQDKIQYIFILEQDDKLTIEKIVAYSLQNPHIDLTVLTLPHTLPRTKPKALNTALPYLKGDYCVVYDAEDRPEPLQLRKAANGFVQVDEDVIALQARLTFYNGNRCWITKVFCLEYDVWFWHYLPSLIRAKMPIPLSGTSTHFRVQSLLDIGGWDAYNVTEDCDLGMRIARAGQRTLLLDSVTYEESPITFTAWLGQRTRWLKGYLQTQNVHTRSLWQALKDFGLYGFCGFCLVVGMHVLFSVLYPMMFLYSFYWCSVHFDMVNPPLNIQIHFFMLLLLLVGILLPVFQTLLVYHRLKVKTKMWIYALMHPFYGMMISLAAYRAMIELIYAPSYWSKTSHGIDCDVDLIQ